MGPENRPNLQLDGLTCDLCWERFDTAKDLAAHVEQEEWTLYPLGVE